MPELPEVETIRRDLQPHLVGRAVERVAVHGSAKRGRLPRELETELQGRRVEALDRHGKRLIARLDDGRAWVLQLGMTGLLLLRPCDKPPAASRFERACVDFGGGTELRFMDMRNFGRWSLAAGPREAIARMGPDWLSEECTPERLHGRLQRRRTPVKAALLDQGVAAGVGNLYADEALWRARIHPTTPANSLGAAEVERLHAAVLETLREAVDARGDSFKAAERGYQYLDAFGEEGRYCRRVYRRDDKPNKPGKPCDRCDKPIARIRGRRQGEQASHYCPRCQPAPRAAVR